MLYRVIVLIFALLLYFPGIGSADYVGMDKARIVAQNWITHCISAYGSWAGVSSPTISGEETLMHQNEVVGFNFLIYPKGNILVTARDDLPVAKLCTDVGIASQMEYGCTLSTANISADVFKTFFRYMNTAIWVKRSDYSSLSAWLQVFKNEIQNGRPSELGVTDPKNNTGHSVVVDGYRDTPLETVHINMGWGGSYDAGYVPDSFIYWAG
jgi:hypothetical protein